MAMPKYRTMGIFRLDGAPLLTRAEAAREQVIVQGIYLVSAVGSMARMAGMAGVDASRIVYSEAGILPDSADDVLAWIVKAVAGWRGVK